MNANSVIASQCSLLSVAKVLKRILYTSADIVRSSQILIKPGRLWNSWLTNQKGSKRGESKHYAKVFLDPTWCNSFSLVQDCGKRRFYGYTIWCQSERCLFLQVMRDLVPVKTCFFIGRCWGMSCWLGECPKQGLLCFPAGGHTVVLGWG